MKRICLILLGLLLASTPSWAESVGAAARGAFKDGREAQSDGRAEVARKAFARAAELAPEWGLAFLEWGILEETLDPKGPLALECLRKAATLAPGNPRVHFHLGAAYAHRDQHADAIRELKSALALRNDFPDAKRLLGLSLAASGAHPEAIQTLEQVIDADRSNAAVWSTLADLYEQEQRTADAERALVAITAAQPQVAFSWVRLAQFYERTGSPQKARQAFAKAEAMSPRPPRKMRKLK